jgi:autotransporter-associated beta strand protein
LEVVAAGDLTVATLSAVGNSGFGSTTGNNSIPMFRAGGGAGGGILLSGGTGLTLTGTLDVRGGDASASPGAGNSSGGGGGRLALTGLSSYTFGTNPFSFNLNGGNGSGNGFAGVITVDALTTTINGGTSITLTGDPIVSVAGSTTQTAPTIEAYARHDLSVTGNITLGADNAFQRLDAAGKNITTLFITQGTFDLNGFSETLDVLTETIGSSALVKIPAASTLTVGVNGGSATFVGQFTGAGSIVKAGSGTWTLNGSSPAFTGPTTVTGGLLTIAGPQALQSSTVTLAGGGLNFSFVGDPILGALAGTGPVPLTGLGFNSLTVGGNNASTTLSGSLSGSPPGGVIKAGGGTWTLTGTNTQSGPLKIQGGTVLVGSTGALSATAPITVSAGATLDLNGFNYTVTPSNALIVQGNLRLGLAGVTAVSGATATYTGGTITGGYLRGAGTHVVTGGALLSGVTTFGSTTVNVAGVGSFQNFTNGGTINVAAGLPGAMILDGFSNEGSGSMTVGAVSKVNATDFQSYGTLTINPATVTQNFSQTTLMTNTGTSPLSFNGGSRTFVGTPTTAIFPGDWPNVGQRGQPTFVAGIDLNGKNAVVAGGLFVNNGYVEDSTGGFTGTATVVADFGSLVKGAGFFQNSVQTINGGKFQAGNSPGVATFGKFVFGPGGVSNYVFAIDDATGTAGPSPDAAGHVSGWGLVRVGAPPVIDRGLDKGDFVWTATPADKLVVSLQTLVNPTTVGVDIPGPMDHFDPTRGYVWAALEWGGSYVGSADAATLDAATVFDTSGFANPVTGGFGWQLDAGGHSLSLVYTPVAVPEPGSLALTGMAVTATVALRRRRRVS